jgi:superfamily II DNA or RNA helicase
MGWSFTALILSQQWERATIRFRKSNEASADLLQTEVGKLKLGAAMEKPNRITEIEDELRAIDIRRQNLLSEIKSLRREAESPQLPLTPAEPRSSDEKIALFLSLFGARQSVYPRLWENPRTGRKGYSPACRNEWSRGICEKPRVKCSECPHQDFPQLDQAAVHAHLTGQQTIGTYAIREDDTCIFLAADFDGDGWADDVAAYRRAGEDLGACIAVERSRSGNGAHAWIFFAQPVAATLARRLGTLIVARASAVHAGIALSTYDRFFPNQDTLPEGGLGNLIALPLQHRPRRSGNTVFLDEHFEPYPDQWGYLANVDKVGHSEIRRILDSIPKREGNEQNDPNESSALRFDELALDVIPQAVRRGVFSGTVLVERRCQLEIGASGLPSTLKAALKRLATIANPVFYEKQRLRFPTFNIPRFIFCGAESAGRLVLPRGTLEEMHRLIRKAGGQLSVNDQRPTTTHPDFSFLGFLTKSQEAAVSAMMKHDEGVLVAPPGAGKTVMGCAAIVRRREPVLILVHRKPLMDQWVERLQRFLNLSKREIHILGNSRYRDAPVGIGMLQSLARSESPSALMGRYAHVIIDECHHVPAASFEAVMKQCEARHILGLTATPTRKDGLQKILFLQCGPVRHRVDFDHAADHSRIAIVREIHLMAPPGKDRLPLHQLWKWLIESEERNRMIVGDIVSAHEEGRVSAVLSDRKEHLQVLERMLRVGLSADALFRIDGSIGRKERTHILDSLRKRAEAGNPFVLLATASLLGEGFDLPELDTLFLAMPISFKGRLIQYAGRLHRVVEGKKSVRIYVLPQTE